MRVLGGGLLVAAVLAATAVAAVTVPVHVLKRPAHVYDKLPAKFTKKLGKVELSRRVATAVDAKRNGYLVYVAKMKDGSICVLLVQGLSYRAQCAPAGALFDAKRRTFSVIKGLIGGIAADGVKRVVLVGQTARKTLQLTPDGGYIYGCPAPTNCATWVREVLGYDASGKLISTERTH